MKLYRSTIAAACFVVALTLLGCSQQREPDQASPIDRTWKARN